MPLDFGNGLGRCSTDRPPTLAKEGRLPHEKWGCRGWLISVDGSLAIVYRVTEGDAYEVQLVRHGGSLSTNTAFATT